MEEKEKGTRIFPTIITSVSPSEMSGFCNDDANRSFRFFFFFISFITHGYPMITRVFPSTGGMGSKMCLMSTRSYVFGRGGIRSLERAAFV